MLKRHGKYLIELDDLDTWVSYVNKLDKESPYKTMIAVLQKQFDEKQFVGMLLRRKMLVSWRRRGVAVEQREICQADIQSLQAQSGRLHTYLNWILVRKTRTSHALYKIQKYWRKCLLRQKKSKKRG